MNEPTTTKHPRNVAKLNEAQRALYLLLVEYLKPEFTGSVTLMVNIKEGFIQDPFEHHHRGHGKLP